MIVRQLQSPSRERFCNSLVEFALALLPNTSVVGRDVDQESWGDNIAVTPIWLSCDNLNELALQVLGETILTSEVLR